MGKNLEKPLGHRVPEETHERLARLATARGTSKGQVIIDALALLEVGKDLTQTDVLRWIKANTKKGK